jgi:hypothetical protein
VGAGRVLDHHAVRLGLVEGGAREDVGRDDPFGEVVLALELRRAARRRQASAVEQELEGVLRGRPVPAPVRAVALALLPERGVDLARGERTVLRDVRQHGLDELRLLAGDAVGPAPQPAP